ncbi:hypothetical protein GQR58_018890 [Nymphon striatum]|nr:hypothetical protein GQR58_018890 [Nymphon striatum]
MAAPVSFKGERVSLKKVEVSGLVLLGQPFRFQATWKSHRPNCKVPSTEQNLKSVQLSVLPNKLMLPSSHRPETNGLKKKIIPETPPVRPSLFYSNVGLKGGADPDDMINIIFKPIKRSLDRLIMSINLIHMKKACDPLQTMTAMETRESTATAVVKEDIETALHHQRMLTKS